MGIPPPGRLMGTSACPHRLARRGLNGAYCCNVFELAHLPSEHHEYGGEQFKNSILHVPEKMFSCALLAETAVTKQNISHQPSFALQPGMLLVTRAITENGTGPE